MMPRPPLPDILARRNELLVRIRQPYDMAGQVLAAIVIALLLDGELPALWRFGYVGATLVVVLLQYFAHRAFRADRDRSRRPTAWWWRLAAIYALNGALFGSMIVILVTLPREPSPLLALMVIIGMTISVSLTISVQLVLSAMVILLATVPATVVLLLGDLPDGKLFAAIGIILATLLLSFAHRLNRYFRRSTELVQRLRNMLQDRTRTSEHAEEAQRRLRLILDTAPFPIVVARRQDGAFLYSNRPAAELFGIEGNPAAAAPRYVLDPLHHQRIFGEQGAQSDEELQIATAQGKTIWATIAAVPMRYAEEDAALVVVNDVTAKRASEEKLREAEQRLSDALVVAPDGIALFDAEDRLVICNKAYADIIGVPLPMTAGMSHDEVCRRSVTSRPRPEQAGVRTDYEGWIAERLRTFKAANGEPHIFFDTRSRRWLQIRDFRLASGGTASLITDISELKARERELREANENLAAQAEMLAARSETLEAARKTAIKAHQDAEYANRAKSQFLAHMSHELRTPLNAIIGFSEIMALHLLGPSGVPQYDRYAQDILTAGRHLLSVIDDILDLSKVEAGKMKLACDHVPWNRLANDCLTLLRPQADGGAVVEVADTGVGMAPEDVQKALEPFGRIDSALVSQMRGTGLGLPLVKALIELHGGRLEVESAVGQGTVIRLYFPGPRAQLAAG